MDRESYRSEFYGSDETGVEAVAKKKHKLKVDIRKGKMIIKDYLQKIEDLEFDKITMATKKVSKNKMMVRLEKEIEEIKIQNKEDEDVLESIKGETDWYKWYNDFHKDKKSMRKVEGENRISYYEKYVKSIVVNLNKDNINHTIKINFKLAIVDDKLVWRDKSNKKLGYSISKGKKVKEFLLKKNS
jgi:predicted HicB family RNase H-like nuclease